MRVALLGDIAFFGKYDIVKKKSLKKYFQGVSEFLGDFDFVIGNLETPFVSSGKSHGHKSAYIYANPSNIELLKYLNINIVNLANNHIFDYGLEGYENTKRLLDENDIKYFGIENKPEFINHHDVKVALHGYCCYSTNPIGIYNGGSYGINRLDLADVKSNLLKFQSEGYLNLISIHAGQEHVNFPNKDHIKLARYLSNLGPYIFYGHHPHVLQGIEQHRDSLIAYSLGNFCFDDVYTPKSSEPLIKQNENNKSSVILTLEIKGGNIVDYKPVGIFVGENEFLIHHKPSEEKLKVYSANLSMPDEAYCSMRRELLGNYINDRKSMRNLEWYLKRLNHNSIFMLVASRRNKRLYKKHLLSKLYS